MIVTCPHCQGGFYIASELAGKVIVCSKCKKQVRAPDRQAGGLSGQANDGIPTAILAETRVEVDERLKTEAEARAEMEKILKEALDARAKAETQAKVDSEARQEAEERLRREVQTLAAIEARLLTETEAKEKTEQALAAARAMLCDAEVAELAKEPINFNKGLKRLTILLSFATAWIGGVIAHRNGYIIWSHFDRPVYLPGFAEPVYLPIVLIAFCAGGFAAAWVAYLVVIFVIKGFSGSSETKKNKQHLSEPAVEIEEPTLPGGARVWRSP
jgi:predicted Zn finger-like uncharacterized protein